MKFAVGYSDILGDKFFLNQYGEYCHDFTNNQMNYCILKPLGVGYRCTNWFTPVATFEFYLKNGLKMGRFHGGTHIRLTDRSTISLQIFHVLSPGNKFQEFYFFSGYILNI